VQNPSIIKIDPKESNDLQWVALIELHWQNNFFRVARTRSLVLEIAHTYTFIEDLNF